MNAKVSNTKMNCMTSKYLSFKRTSVVNVSGTNELTSAVSTLKEKNGSK